MNNRKTLEELRKFLLEKVPPTQVEMYISQVKPLYDFYDYMYEKYNMTFEQVEEDSFIFSQKVLPDYLKDISKSSSPLKFIIEISGDIMKRYANKYDYDKSEEVKKALNTYMEYLYVSNLIKKSPESENEIENDKKSENNDNNL